jgi:dihydroneopterin aldolase
MDRIFIEKLSLRGKHGVHEQERKSEQEFLIDISAEFDTRKAALSEDLADTLNYVRFCDIARETVENNSFFLIEKLAETIAQEILMDMRIQKVEVTVRKPEVLESGIPGITIFRTSA